MIPIRYLPAVIAGLLTACAQVPAPIVEMKGVDPDTYNKDLANCYIGIPFFSAGNAVTKCMKAKGYRVLFSN